MDLSAFISDMIDRRKEQLHGYYPFDELLNAIETIYGMVCDCEGEGLGGHDTSRTNLAGVLLYHAGQISHETMGTDHEMNYWSKLLADAAMYLEKAHKESDSKKGNYFELMEMDIWDAAKIITGRHNELILFPRRQPNKVTLRRGETHFRAIYSWNPENTNPGESNHLVCETVYANSAKNDDVTFRFQKLFPKATVTVEGY